MRNWVKVLLKISAILLVVGIALGVLAFVIRGGKSFSLTFEDGKLVSSDNYETYVLPKTNLDEFTSLDIDVSLGDIEIITTDDTYAIEYSVYGNEPSYSVENGVLKFTDGSTGTIGFDFRSNNHNYVTIYVPKDVVLENATIDNSCGDLHATGITFNEGSIDFSCGDIILSDIDVSNILTLENSCGDIVIEDSSFKDIEANLSCGDITITTSNVDNSATIDNSCGDIKVSLTNSNVAYDLDVSAGEIKVNGAKTSDSCTLEGGSPVINIDNSCGDITLDYEV